MILCGCNTRSEETSDNADFGTAFVLAKEKVFQPIVERRRKCHKLIAFDEFYRSMKDLVVRLFYTVDSQTTKHEQQAFIEVNSDCCVYP